MMWKVPFRDLSVQDPLKAELLEAVDRVLTHGQLLLGPEVEKFEKCFAENVGVQCCVGVASGTDALDLALRSLDLEPGDEVITTPLSWIATLNVIRVNGYMPVFVDINEDLNIDAKQIEQAISPKTKVILPVHFTGRMSDMNAIMSLARQYNLKVIEDAAQAFSSRLNGRSAGAFGDLAAFSLNPMKILPAYGEAGAVVTNDKKLLEKLIALRYQGTIDREVCHYPSLNAKIDALQAALLMVSMRYCEDLVRKRIEIARYYTEELQDTIRCPKVVSEAENRAVFFDYTVEVDKRDDLQKYLSEQGIETKIKHPILMPNQPAYRDLPRPSLPVAERVVTRILSLPIHEKLSFSDLEYVVANIKSFYGR